MENDGIVPVLKAAKKGITLAIVSGRAACPLEMVPAISMQSWPSNTNFAIMTLYGMDTDRSRIQAVKQAQSMNAKYIWFVDDDTVPPADAGRHLVYILEQKGPPHGKAMVAGGIYCTRSSPPEPIVYQEQGAGPFWDWRVGETFECWGLGTGCMMVNMQVFEHIPEPWFLTTDTATHKETDDLYFCARVHEAGYQVWAHGGILCHHYDLDKGITYQLPRGSRPYQDRLEDFHEPQL